MIALEYDGNVITQLNFSLLLEAMRGEAWCGGVVALGEMEGSIWLGEIGS